MSSVLLKVLIATAAAVAALVAFLSMAAVQGRVRPGSFDPGRLRKLHRAAGDLFALLLLPLIWIGLDFFGDGGDGLPLRGIFHVVIAEFLVVMVLFKVLFSRAWRGFLKYAPTLGFAIAALFVVTYLNTAGYYALRAAADRPLPAVQERETAAAESAPGADAPDAAAASAKRGAGIYSANCALCHSTEHARTGPPPGLKGVLKVDALPSSGRAATAENVRSQLRDPIGRMPSFERLTEAQVDDLIAYLRTL